MFGRGGEEAAALARAGIPFEIVPGVTSPVAGPAYAGIPVTHRETARSVAFITGHHAEDDDVPATWRRAAQSADTLVFLMGVKNLPFIVKAVMEGGRSPSTPVAIVRRATLPDQSTVTGTLQTIESMAEGIKPPALIIIGDVAALGEELSWRERKLEMPLVGVGITLVGRGPKVFDLGLALFDAGAEIGAPDTSHGALVFSSGLRDASPDWLSRFASTGTLIAMGQPAQQMLAESGLQADFVPEPFQIDTLLKKVTAWREL